MKAIFRRKSSLVSELGISNRFVSFLQHSNINCEWPLGIPYPKNKNELYLKSDTFTEKALMTSTLSNLCDRLNSSLTNGDIRLIPPIILKIKQILSRNAKFTGEDAEIEFEKLSDDLIELKTILTAIKNYTAWVSKLKAMDLSDINDGSEDFEILIGEINVPLIWDYSVDPIFIEEEYEHKEPLVQYLTKNNQLNIFTYSNGEIFDTVNDHAVSVFDAHEYFNSLDRVLGINCQFVSRNRSEQADFIDYIVQIIGDVRSRRNTIVHLNNIWQKNQKAGFKLRLNGRSHEGLIPFIKDKNVLVVSPGPSLKHSIKLITDECRKKFTIVAVAQSMPALAKYQVKPDFVIVIDPADFSYVLDDWDDLTDIKLIGEESIHVSFLEKNFEEIYTVVTNKDSMGLDIYFDIPPMDLDGGTVPLATCSLAQQLQAASITLIGQDLSISDANYFVSGGLHEKKIVEQNNRALLNAKVQTVYGDDTTVEFSPYLRGSYSVHFDGTNFLELKDHADFDFGANDFTIELWVYMTAYDTSGFNNFIYKGGSKTTSWHFDYKNSTNELRFYTYLHNAPDLTLVATQKLTLGKWYHLSCTRRGNIVTIYKNGISIVTTSDFNNNIDKTTDNVYIGQRVGVNGNDRGLQGFISGLRIVRGTSIVPSDGGPDEPVRAITNTSLLTCHSPYIADGSSRAHKITKGRSETVYQQAIPIFGWNNEELLTSPEYAVYLVQFENFAANKGNIALYNASVGGANIRGFQNTTIEDLIRDLPENCSKRDLNIKFIKNNYDGHVNFLLETQKSISDVLLPIKKAVKILKRKNRVQENKLVQLDGLEKKIITISKSNEYLSTVVSHAIIRLNRAVLYVADLDENLKLSLSFYQELNAAFTLYKRALESAIKVVEGINFHKGTNK